MSGAPFGRRQLTVTGNEQLGAYRVLRVADPEGPQPLPGQFAMIATAERWGGGEEERPFLPRAYSIARHVRGEQHFLLEDVGPGSRRLCELRAGEQLLVLGPLGRPFAMPGADHRAILVGGGAGIAPLGILQDALAGEVSVLLGFRDAARVPGAALLGAPVQLATDDGSAGHHGRVTELLASELQRDARVRVYACGPAPMLEGVRMLCAQLRVPAQLALEAPMACGFGACFGCVVPRRGGGYLRVCVDGPVLDAAELERVEQHAGGTRVSVEFCGLALAHRVINGSGTFDLLAASEIFGERLARKFPFSAYVSKTITLEPRAGNPPPRLWEASGGLINSIGLPNKGLERYLEQELPLLAGALSRAGAAVSTGPVPLITNVMGSDEQQISTLLDACEPRPEIAALELNVSCPNVHTGLDIGADPRQLERVVRAVRGRTSKPLIVKLTPNTADVAACARAAQDGGADAVSLINTLRALALAPDEGPARRYERGRGAQRGWLGGGSGGLSGPAVRAVALAQVAAVAESVAIPVIGMGGVQSAAHARDLLDVGATLVAVGTESFRDPAAGARIARAL